jgi:hypothetical protein
MMTNKKVKDDEEEEDRRRNQGRGEMIHWFVSMPKKNYKME